MKIIFKTALFAAAIFATAQTKASTIHRDTTLGHKISKTAKKVGNKTANVASNTASHVVDKKYEGKYGPGGETVYIDKDSHYYYVNKTGHRVYLKKSELMDKKM